MTPDKGSITFNIPYALDESGNTISITQDYINFYDSGDYEYNVQVLEQSPTFSQTGSAFIRYLGVGSSRITEKLKYGKNEFLNGESPNIGVTSEGLNYTGYTFEYPNETIHYTDYDGGYTMIRGETSGYTKEEVFETLLTRNEHFLGFVEEPRIYSDVFVDRGKQGVMERNLRLGEIDNIGELSIYGNGFFKIKKQ